MNAAIDVLLQRLKAPAEIADELAGADANLARRMALWMIEQGGPVPSEGRAVLDEVASLHRREAEGEAVDPARWRAVARQAVGLGQSSDPGVRRAGSLGEAAAWSLSKARSILSDLFTCLTLLASQRGSAESGWTPADNAAAQQVFDGLQAEGVARELIPGRFAAIDPELSRRFVAQLDGSNAAALALPAQVLSALQRLARETQ